MDDLHVVIKMRISNSKGAVLYDMNEGVLEEKKNVFGNRDG